MEALMEAPPVFERFHTVEGGIERIIYTPVVRRLKTPLLLQHGMFAGAWHWQQWQALFGRWGWESHAHSLMVEHNHRETAKQVHDWLVAQGIG